ncbi:LuxR C-terminal-related transcriptional regulator [Amycolatopsis alkalitolerans]|uniref:Helix-turn-helix transcriptional regulator n=1 Tax=Amycolatopsis alkalitolerans TaxID=2547244 RepID=A0A5C4MA98_9PSEU|nr:LuxR C-terminal-related transcriptional regulator [Amycolatopsis alkalitolerans]TNC29139.1 helix-turn-helix transcriptional regulator [Amycolatopsis alkalitolerans]
MAVPHVPEGFVRRESLLDRLKEAAEAPVAMVCAPAGYGKTLLLADWFTASDTANMAWLSLDSTDNTPDQFWTATLHALGEHGILPEHSPLRTLVPRSGDIVGFLAEFTDGLDELPGPFWLVLDDFHEIVDTETLRGIATLLRQQPEPVRLVLSSRLDPPLPLARLRLQERLRSLRASDLRFSEPDAAALLETCGIRLTSQQLHRLVEQTDGWAAGLRLAARPLRQAADRNAFLDEFTSDDRAVADYLVGEVLAGLPEETKDLLATVSVCDEVAPSLATELSSREDAGVILDQLERECSLVMAIGRERRWYRVHPLLRSYLRGELDRRLPDRAMELNHAAATWFAAEQLPREALDHAARAEETETVMRLLRDHAVALLLGGDHEIVAQTLFAVGHAVVDADPWLTLLAAATHLERGELDIAGTHLAHAEETDPDAGTELGSLWRLVMGTYDLARGRPRRLVSLDWHAVVAGHDRPGLEIWARLNAGWASLCTGRRDLARQEFDVAHQISRGLGLDYLVMHVLLARGTVAGLEGDLAGLRAAAAEAVAIAERNGWQPSPWAATGRVMLGFAHLAHFDPEAAVAEIDTAKGAIGGESAPRLSYLAAVVECGARFDLGERRSALEKLGHARRALAQHSLLPELAVAGALVEYRCALLLGRDATAREVLRWAQRRAGNTAEVALMTAWAQVARGDLGCAVCTLEDGGAALLTETVAEGHLLRSAVAIHSGQRTRAREELEQAVRGAEAAGLVRPFQWADPLVRQLLVDQIGSFGAADAFAAGVRRALVASSGNHDGLLTEREHVVLSRLGAQRSLDEVATDLSVSVNTIKTHVRAIYAKLGVNNRRAAVLTARSRGLA